MHFLKFQTFFRLYRSATKLYRNIHSDPLDEEKTYIFLYRFMLIYKHLKNIENDKTFIEIRFGKEAANARSELIQLEQKLIDRYKELENDKLQKEIRESEKKREIVDVGSKSLFNQGRNYYVNGVCGITFFIVASSITCLELIKVYEKSKNVLIIDARSEEDYQESHIRDFENMNIPENLILSG